jgi:hypothetical protein
MKLLLYYHIKRVRVETKQVRRVGKLFVGGALQRGGKAPPTTSTFAFNYTPMAKMLTHLPQLRRCRWIGGMGTMQQ